MDVHRKESKQVHKIEEDKNVRRDGRKKCRNPDKKKIRCKQCKSVLRYTRLSSGEWPEVILYRDSDGVGSMTKTCESSAVLPPQEVIPSAKDPENVTANVEIDDLKKENYALNEKIASLNAAMERLQKENTRALKKITSYEEACAALIEDNTALRKTNKDLASQLRVMKAPSQSFERTSAAAAESNIARELESLKKKESFEDDVADGDRDPPHASLLNAEGSTKNDGDRKLQGMQINDVSLSDLYSFGAASVEPESETDATADKGKQRDLHFLTVIPSESAKLKEDDAPAVTCEPPRKEPESHTDAIADKGRMRDLTFLTTTPAESAKLKEDEAPLAPPSAPPSE
eukprot:g20.t1